MHIKIEKKWTVSNILSLSRVILLVPVVVLLLKPGDRYRSLVVALMFVAALTDFLDGLIARAFNQVTDFGKLLDPVADKICIVSVVIVLVIVGDIPLWFAVIAIARDIIILVGSMYVMNRDRIVVQSMWPGKIAVTFIAAYIIVATLRQQSLIALKEVLLVMSTVFIFYSVTAYALKYLGIKERHGIV
ncbi:MAG: CDP-alcohol phosphatidyltransferase family protein [Candidatus Kryptoniota bacterium]